jgi:hypothetical protein
MKYVLDSNIALKWVLTFLDVALAEREGCVCCPRMIDSCGRRTSSARVTKDGTRSKGARQHRYEGARSNRSKALRPASRSRVYRPESSRPSNQPKSVFPGSVRSHKRTSALELQTLSTAIERTSALELQWLSIAMSMASIRKVRSAAPNLPARQPLRRRQATPNSRSQPHRSNWH